MKNLGYEVTLLKTNDDTKNIRAKVKQACIEKWESIFIAGGDGTINEIIQYISEERYKPSIGLIPLGTCNEFAKFLGISNVKKAIAIIKKSNEKAVDIGRIGNIYFTNIAAAGWLGELIYKTPSHLKSKFGKLAYVYYFTKHYWVNPEEPITLKIGDHQNEGEISFFMIMNGDSVGPFRKIHPKAFASDGVFHLLAIKRCNRLALFFILMSKLFHLPVKNALVYEDKITAMSFHLPNHLPVNIDGDRKKADSFTFQVLPKHIKIYVPN